MTKEFKNYKVFANKSEVETCCEENEVLAIAMRFEDMDIADLIGDAEIGLKEELVEEIENYLDELNAWDRSYNEIEKIPGFSWNYREKSIELLYKGKVICLWEAEEDDDWEDNEDEEEEDDVDLNKRFWEDSFDSEEDADEWYEGFFM